MSVIVPRREVALAVCPVIRLVTLQVTLKNGAPTPDKIYDGTSTVKADGVTKILTIEASGIGIACLCAQQFSCPVVFAKKAQTKNISGDIYTSKIMSFTHGREYDILVSAAYLRPEDRILLIDDFLANGEALRGLIDLVRQSGATLVGAGIAIEKAFQPGGDAIRATGVRVESLARIASMDPETGIVFVGE